MAIQPFVTEDLVIQDSEAITASKNGGDFTNQSAKGLILIVDITAVAGVTPSLTLTIEGKDPASGKYYTILASAALSAVATTALLVYPGIVAAANLKADFAIPEIWRARRTIAGSAGQSVTYSLGATYVA